MSSIIQILVMIAVFVSPITVLASIITFIVSFSKDELQKKKMRKTSLWLFLGPIIMTVILVTIWALMNLEV